MMRSLGLETQILDDEDFKKPKKPKKKGHKITFSDDDDDFSLSPKPSSSKDS